MLCKSICVRRKALTKVKVKKSARKQNAGDPGSLAQNEQWERSRDRIATVMTIAIQPGRKIPPRKRHIFKRMILTLQRFAAICLQISHPTPDFMDPTMWQYFCLSGHHPPNRTWASSPTHTSPDLHIVPRVILWILTVFRGHQHLRHQTSSCIHQEPS
jgi:hypothetical protein